jgi:hypothetical protein
VKLLRAHIKRYGTTPDGRIFQTARGGILQDSAYGAVWTEARKQALTPAQCRSPLGRRPYDLRHAAVSLWLNSGVPATEVARRAGHGVAVLLIIYAHCIDGQADAANKRITDALGTQDTRPEPNPATREMTTARRHPEMPGQRNKDEQAVGITAPAGPARGFFRPVRGLTAGLTLRSCSSAAVLAAWRDWCSVNRLQSWRCRTRREAGSAGVLVDQRTS